MVYMYNIFFIHSSADGHLGYFQVLATVNSAAMNKWFLQLNKEKQTNKQQQHQKTVEKWEEVLNRHFSK